MEWSNFIAYTRAKRSAKLRRECPTFSQNIALLAQLAVLALDGLKFGLQNRGRAGPGPRRVQEVPPGIQSIGLRAQFEGEDFRRLGAGQPVGDRFTFEGGVVLAAVLNPGCVEKLRYIINS
jgi:hypothetical protein